MHSPSRRHHQCDHAANENCIEHRGPNDLHPEQDPGWTGEFVELVCHAASLISTAGLTLTTSK